MKHFQNIFNATDFPAPALVNFCWTGPSDNLPGGEIPIFPPHFFDATDFPPLNCVLDMKMAGGLGEGALVALVEVEVGVDTRDGGGGVL